MDNDRRRLRGNETERISPQIKTCSQHTDKQWNNNCRENKQTIIYIYMIYKRYIYTYIQLYYIKHTCIFKSTKKYIINNGKKYYIIIIIISIIIIIIVLTLMMKKRLKKKWNKVTFQPSMCHTIFYILLKTKYRRFKEKCNTLTLKLPRKYRRT